jgi:DNA-3-methyladenine glycosylase
LVSETSEFRRQLTQLPVKNAARRLLGCEIVAPDCRIKIVEAEAYGGSEDLGSHGCRGSTPRNAPMFGRAGLAYVYFTYGNHWMLNVVCRPEGECGAVLIRGAVPLRGLASMRERRPKARSDFDLLSGPGKIAAAIGIDGSSSGIDLLERASGFRLVARDPVKSVIVSTRIGIAAGKGDETPWRFIDADELKWASKPWPRL